MTTTSKARKKNFIKISFTQERDKEDVQMFLRDQLVALLDDIDQIEYEGSETITSVVVFFSSAITAENAVKVLQSESKEYTVLLDINVRKSEIEDLKSKLDIEYKAYQKKHDKKITDLNDKLCQLKPKGKYLPLEEYEKITKERDILKSKIDEYQQHRREFEDFVQLHLTKLSHLSIQSEVSALKAKLEREFARFSNALPIYARRSEIVQTVLRNHVTVLVGETGSGKSTQVVQYLYEAGMAQHGFIVCTQPRKVAAITLAKHVSKEMHVELGEELGYQVGMNARCCRKTRILYMTDHMLLNECIADQSLSKYKCILIDEAHERSINTDILLAFLKQCLPSRPDLKLVIMSATIEPELFVKYFKHDLNTQTKGTTSVSTMMVSGRTFPVEVEYNPLHSKEQLSSDTNYVMDAVEIAKRIHTTEQPGDVLVFLTCAPEIETACRTMDRLQPETIILPLHGKLPPDEQQKVFKDSGSKRKIIFSTNVAETSVTIPGVRYVIDTGLAKEMYFDSRKNMDSLEVQLISKSSAEQRKGRAGRMSAGKCYRLYTAEDYEVKMPDRTKPEILRIQLSQVVLKLLEFGIPNVLTFDFVEHPDSDALNSAVDTLKFVGAIRDNILTETGKKMAALPIAPQLAKVLLDGVNIGLGTEALTSVALSSLAGQVFFRGGTDEMKEEGDKMKLKFYHAMGDQMTNLLVYQHWQEQKKEARTKWCLENYVNAKSMRIAEETIKELRYILKQKLKVDVPLELQSLDAAECYLCKLYFSAFLTNLAVYLGHERAGYMTVNKCSGSFIIFPGSSLRHMNSTPQYVIYEKTLKTSQQFLTQVSHVKQEWVNEAVQVRMLPEDPVVTFSDYMVTPFHIIAVGPQMFREVLMRKKELLDTFMTNNPASAICPVIDLSAIPKQWGIIRAFAQRQYHNAITHYFNQIVRQKQTDFEKHTREFGVVREQDSTRVVIGSGGTIQEVVLPFQFRTVIAVCSKERVSVDLLKCELLKYGKILRTKELSCLTELRLSVTYNTSNAAQRALIECDLQDVTLRPWKSQQFTLKLQWERRQRGSFAFLTFDNHIHCVEACQYLHNRIFFHGNQIKVRFDRNKDTQLFLTGDILCTCNEDDLKDVIQEYFGPNLTFGLKMGYKKYLKEEHFYHEYYYEDEDQSDTDSESNDGGGATHDSEIEEHSGIDQVKEEMEIMITAILTKYADPSKYTVKFIVPNEWDIFYRAYVIFNDTDEGYKVLHSKLKHEYIDGKNLIVSPDLKCSIAFRREIFILLKDILKNTRKSLLQKYTKVLRIKVFPPDDKKNNVAIVSVIASDVKAFAVAQKNFHLAAEPLMLSCNTPELREYILCQTCPEELSIVQTTTTTYIYRDLNTMNIKIYGIKDNQQIAMDMINDKAKELFSGGAQVIEVSLRDKEIPGLMKRLVLKYGYDLSGMLELKGVRRVSLNPRLQVISLLMTAKGQSNVEACIKEFSISSQANTRMENSEYEFDCSACFTFIDDSKDLFRLECCGHAFHIECIAVQMKSDTLTFPVKCASEECSKEFVLKDFENLQKRLKFRMKDLVSLSLQKYMEKNSDRYKNCPTPDCKMIYAKTKESREFTCESCSISTCTTCHKQYHAGISCEVYNLNKEGEEELVEWMKGDPENRKRCPQCLCPIEKNKGCMHMNCRCGAHICWRCMKLFKSAMDCYDHQKDCLQPVPLRLPPPIVRPNPVRPAVPNHPPRREQPVFNATARPVHVPDPNPNQRPAAGNRPSNEGLCHIL